MKTRHIISLLVLAGLVAGPVYAKKDKEKPLPPGLQKKVARGGELPPGWQKKLVRGEKMEQAVYDKSEIVVPVDSKGLLTVRVEGKLVKLYEATREIAEVLE